MTTSTALRPSVRAAFTGLIDYAGLFPPAQLSLDAARREYHDARGGPHAWMLGRFILTAPQLGESAKTLHEPFSVIVDPDVDALHRLARLRAAGATVEAVEIPLQKSVSPFRERLLRDDVLNILGALEADLGVSGLRDLPAFVEIPRTKAWWSVLRETLDAAARFQLGAKLRCGGLTAEAFPGIDEVTEFIAAASDAGVPFKATAGLHHPVRHVDPASGFIMHGFLNLLAAAALAPSVDRATLSRIVAEEEPGAFVFGDDSFAWRNETVDTERLTEARRVALVAYGSCSFSEPVEDLTALGILPAL
jgi:hypothetical protein